MSKAPPPPLQFSVDLAGTGRACCKKCSKTILVYQPRFCRKVRSPWHDGFDIQLNHLACGIKWCTKLTDIHRLGILDFRELQRAADVWDFDLRSIAKTKTEVKRETSGEGNLQFTAINDPSELLVDFSAYKTMVNMIKKIRDQFLNDGIPLTTMQAILCHNGYDEQMLKTSKFFTLPILAHIISDALLRGVPALCPICQQMALVSFGFSYYCYGWLAPTTRCDYWSSQNPFGDPKEESQPGRYLLEDTRDQSLMIPAQLASLPVWKKIGQFLKKLHEQKEYSIYENWKAKVLAGHSKRRDVKQTALLKNMPRSQLMAGMFVSTWGSLKTLDRKLLEAAIKRYGGLYTADNKQLGNPPRGTISICFIDEENWGSLKKSETCVVLGTSAIVLKEEYMVALLAKNETEKTKWPVIGAALRLASNMKPYRLGGSRAVDVPFPEIEEDPNPQVQPPIIRNSPLMELHADLQGPLNDPNYHRIVYVDRYNNAFSVRTSKVELRDNKNTYYILQLVEVSRVREDINRKRAAGSVVTVATDVKRLKKSESGSKNSSKADDSIGDLSKLTTTADVGTQAEQTTCPETIDEWRALLYETEFIDQASWSTDLWRQSQLVKSAKYSIYRAWGRLGDDDKTTNGSMTDEYTNLEDCVADFLKKFNELTGLNFYQRHKKAGIPGRHQVVDLRGYVVKQKKTEHAEKNVQESNSTRKDDVLKDLDPDIRELINDIFSQRFVTSTLKEFQVDRTKFSELSSSQISQAYQVLSDIESVLASHSTDPDEQIRIKARLRGLSASLYTVIPRIAKKLEPITDLAMLRRECALIDTLSATADSLSIMSNGSLADHYENMQIKIVKRIDSTTKCYKSIRKYLRNGHGVTHGSRQFELEGLYSLSTNEPSKSEGQRMLLWHGTRASNIASIVCHGGLMIAPPEAPKTGYMFDKGLYFTDVASKAAQYCAPSKSGEIIYLFLFEVDLGEKILELEQANEALLTSDFWAEEQYTAVKGVGRIAPATTSELTIDLDDQNMAEENAAANCPLTLVIPDGKHKKSGADKSSLIYNEYIVYEPAKTKPRFLATVSVDFKAFTDV